MQEIQKLIARIDQDHWILLSHDLGGDQWTFLIWGTYSFSGSFVAVNEADAKKRARCAAREHLQKHGVNTSLADAPELSWQVAVRYIAA